jgi:glucuronate isomerase
MAAGWFAPLLAKVRDLVRSKIDGDADGRDWWQHIAEALADVETYQETIDAIGQTKFMLLLQGVGADDTLVEMVVAKVQQATADEVLATVEAGTAALEAEVARRTQRTADMIALAKALGAIGCRVLLSLIAGLI